MPSESRESQRDGWFPRWSIGFGLEHIGYLTVRWPRIAGLIVLLFTALCAWQLPRVAVDGDLMRVFADSGVHYDRYRKLTETFGTFEDDAYVLVNSPRLTDPAVIERMRELAFDLELNDFAVGTMTPFTLRKPSADGGTVPAVPENMSGPEEVAAVLTDLRENDPIMRNLIVGDLSGVVMILFPDITKTKAPGGMKAMIASLRQIVADYDSEDIHVELTGPPIWSTELLESTIADQAVFSIVGFAIGAIISLLALRSFWGAVLATFTPAIAVIWVIGTVIMVFGSFSFLTNIVVTLVLVVAFAESMYFTFTWLRLWNDGLDAARAIDEATKRVLPAAALTSLTTMVSFGTLIVTQGRGIEEFGWSGMVGIAMAFLTFSTVMPLTMKLAVRLGYKPPRRMSIAVTAPIPVARWLVRRFARVLAVAVLAIAALLLIPHFSLEPRFSFEDYLPRNSKALETAKGIDAGVGGVAPVYVRVPLNDADPNLTDADFERVRKVHEIVEAAVGKGKVISGASMFNYSDAGFSREQIFDAVGPFLKRRFVTDDGTQALVTAFLPTIMDSVELKTIVDKLDVEIAAAGVDGAEVAGYRLMTTFASTDIINSIRTSLMFAIVLNIFLIGLAFRSWRLGLLSVIPNMLPILGTELYLYATGAGLQLTTVIALTIAFGIAVDDTIHFLATYLRQRESGKANEEAVDLSLERIGPALVATTLIICAGTAVVMFSTIPPVALFGTLTVITLFIALLGDLVVLPSMLIAGGRFFRSIGGSGK
ncbi:MAG: MMPL family transporter [Devosia sp.]|nr:MMPL family transporter [Devosia sp.]